MIKQVSVKYTQGATITDETVNLSSTGNVVITSILVGSDGNGTVDFIDSDAPTTTIMCRATVTSNVSTASTNFLYPIFMIDNNLLIKSYGFAEGDIIHVIVNYIDATAGNPLFEPDQLLYKAYASNDTMVDQLLISNTNAYSLNVKSVYVTSDDDTNSIILFVESPLFTPKVAVTNPASGEKTYQLLSSPLVLLPGQKLYFRQSLAEPVTAYASFTKLKP